MHVGNLVHLVELLAMPWRSPSALERTRDRKLRRLVRHAAENVPFYRELFRSLRIDARGIRSVADLAVLPIVSKKDLQSAGQSDSTARNIDLRRCRTQMTSGSTGVPLEVLFRRGDETILNLGWVRAFLSAGLRPWEKRAVFTPKKELPLKRSWYEYLGLLRRKDISTWTPPEAWILEIARWRPHAVMGYVGVMRLFAEAIERECVAGIAPRMVFTTSEILDGGSRALLGSVFHAPVFDIYASAEGGCLAWECQRCSALHVSADSVILEVVKDGRAASPGEDGEVVVTNLHSYAMPFIRYRQGDLARLSTRQRVCGRNFPLLEAIEGRQDDCIVLRSGRKISYSPFYYSVQFAPGVRRWRVVQEDLDTLRVEIEAGPGFDDAATALIEKNLRAIVGDAMRIAIVRVDSLSGDPHRKFRAVSSRVLGR